MFKKIIFSALTFAFAAVPVLSHAEESASAQRQKPESGSVQKKAELNQQFCQSLTTIVQKMGERMKGSYESDKENRLKKTEELKKKGEDKLKEQEQTFEKVKQEAETKLTAVDGKELTDTQKAALEKFKTAVRAAQEARNEAVRKAQETFQAGMKALIEQRSSKMEQNVDSVQAALDAAVEKAKAECAAGTNYITVKKNFDKALVTIRNNAKQTAKVDTTSNGQAEALAKTRNEAVRKAHDQYKAAIDKAMKDLKAAIGSENKLKEKQQVKGDIETEVDDDSSEAEVPTEPVLERRPSFLQKVFSFFRR